MRHDGTRRVWWDRSEVAPEDAHEHLVRAYRDERDAQSARYQTIARYVSCYEHGFGGGVVIQDGDEPPRPERLFFNAAANALDTWVAAVAGTRVVPQATTERQMSGGARARAEDVNKGLEAVWDACGIEALKVEVVRDFGLTGLGALWGYADDDEVTVQRVDPQDIVAARAESRLGAPRCIMLRVLLDRGQALATYAVRGDAEGFVGSVAARRAALEDAAAASVDDWAADEDILEVIVGYHLPSAKGADDGRMVVAVEGATLVDRAWSRQRFPIALYRAKRARRGLWGIPLMRQLFGAQREFEALTSKIELAHHRMGGTHLVVVGGAGEEEPVVQQEISNGQGTVLRMRSGDIKPLTPNAVAPETVRYHADIADGMLRFNGLSPYAAQGQVPAGITGSGEAQRVYADTSNQRLIEAHREIERFSLEVAECILDAIEDVVERHGAYVVRHGAPGGFSEIDWAELIKDRRHMRLRMGPVSFLAQTESAKRARIDEWFNAKLISPSTYKRLSGVADLEAERQLDVSDEEIVDKCIEAIVERGADILPEGTDNFALIVARGTRWINALRVRGDVDPERLDALRMYVVAAERLARRASDAAAPPGGGGALADGTPPSPSPSPPTPGAEPPAPIV